MLGLQFKALSDSLSSEASQASHFAKEATKEAKEAETYSLYNKALGLLSHGDTEKAEAVFRDLIDHDFLQEAMDLLEEKGKGAIHPGLQLLYPIYKNLATLATQRKDYISAIESYIEAVKIDNSELTVWYKMGITALQIEDFQLAKGAFEEGLECNPKHWPCLDKIITVMYALNNYMECLYFISKAFEMEIYYDKGHAIRNKIYQEQPSLKTDTEEFFIDCDRELSSVTIDPSEARKYVDEALQMRKRRQELDKPPEPVRLKFPDKLREYSWQCIGETLIDLYDKAKLSDQSLSLALRVEVPNYDNVACEQDTLTAKEKTTDQVDPDKQDKPSNMSAEFQPQEKDIAMETDDREVEKAMEVDQEEDKQLVETKDLNDALVQDSEKKLMNEVDKSGLKDTRKKAKTTVSPALDTGSVENENEEKTGKLGQELSKTDKAEIPEDSSVSLQEAVSIAHSLLDSLSPMKTSPVSEVTGSINPTFTTAKSVEITKLEKNEINSKDVSANYPTPNATELVNGQKPQCLVKSSSLGFSVSDVQMEDSDCIPDTPDVGTNYCFVKPDSTSHGAILEPNTNLEQKVVEDTSINTSKPPVVLSNQQNLSKEAPVIIDLTEMNSDSESESKRIQDLISASPTAALPPGIMTSLSVNQSRLTSSPLANSKPIYSGAGLLSPISSMKPVSSSSPDIATSGVAGATQGMIPQTSSIVIQDFQNKDHEYSKASQKFGSVSIVTSSQGQMSISGSIPVTQPLFKSIDLNMMETSAGIVLDMDDRNLAGKKVQKKRKISLATEEIMMYGKRRSARVRNTGKKKEEEHGNVKDLLQALLPSTLKYIQDEDNSIMDSSKEENVMVEKSASKENDPGTIHSKPEFKVWDEVSDVKMFLRELNIKNCGLVDIMNKFLHVIGRHWKLKWSDALCPVYIGVFNRARNHIYMPDAMIMYDAPDIIQEVALICLALAELQVDQWLCDRSKVTGSQNLSPVGKSAQTLLEENIPAYFEEDLLFLKVLCCQSDRLGDHWMDHCVRVFWMKSKYAVLRGDIEEAIYCYEKLKDYLEIMKEEYSQEQVGIPNCKIENVITLDLVTSQMDILQKSHCVEETQRLYDMAEYEKVVEILLETFSQPDHKAKVMKVDAEERQSQLKLLQDAMFKTGNYERSLLWGEESMNEAYLEYKTAENPENNSAWLKTMIEILSWLQMVLARDSTAVKSLPSTKLVRFSQNLIKLIDKNMSLPETVTEMVIDTLAPWALLYHLIKYEEDKIESIRLKDSGNSDDFDDAISSSQMLLNVAHDYLGGRSWCTKSDGSLLLFFMDILKEKLEQESNNQEDYQQAFEQCVYCLFGHPNKKAKAKHLQDHNATGITLEWDHAVKVFEYFRPKTVPEFDGYKSETISAELEVLFKRIVPLVPEELKSKFLSHEDVQSYIEGTKDNAPVLKEEMSSKNLVLEDIYYLLGDYYLKNKESVKAIKFYTHDLCVNPDRLDSWAGMALARMSQLESKLTSAEIKMDSPIYKKSIAALRCFKRATEIDDSNAKLWLEYGTLAYQLHAHASKQIRWKRWFAMEQELVDIAVASKRQMLQTALDCFKQASDWNEEEWLHNYMLGKCLEKMRKPVKDVLQYYFQALANVHEEKAKYPKKIIYAYTTPHLAVEALEMYYRIHAVIFKQLMEHSPDSDKLDYKLIVTSMVEANFSQFVLRIEKGQEAKLDRESASSADESSSSAVSSPVKKPTQGSVDHTYFRQKSNPESNTALSSNTEPADKHGHESGVNQDVTDIKTTSVVTTMELHAEQSTDEIVTLTTTKTEFTADMRDEKPLIENKLKVSSNGDIVDQSDRSKDVLADSKSDQLLKSDTSTIEKVSVEEIVKSAINYIKDTIVERENKSQCLNEKTEKPQEEKPEKMEVDEERVHSEAGTSNTLQDSSLDEDIFKGIYKGPNSVNLSKEKEDLCESLLKLPKEDLHRELVNRCRKSFELCLRRFPTHYKSQYRLAQIYYKCTGFKDLEKAHNILFAGSVKWQQLDYMPCPAMFGERKMSKFFQGIWKIPIDEIDRAGSFPSHLNRCIGMALNILKEERDCYTLHQVHLQLNRQPDPGKKYLRDAEKKYYALTSHRYTLDAAEERIHDMKSITDIEQRHKFLLLFYKIWEHGVHKLNKHVERTNKLLAEAYRVVLRKLETLPHQMLLDQAIRFCKHLMSQKLKSDKDTRSQSLDSTSENRSKSGSKHGTEETGKPHQHISLENIMKAQTDLSLKKPQTKKPERETVLNKIPQSEKQLKSTEEKTGDKTEDAIVIDSSDDTDKNTDKESEKLDIKSPVTTTPGVAGAAESETKAPTVKIKMGLLQAVKRLKPAQTAEDGPRVDGEKTGENMDEELEDAQSIDEEIDIPTLDDVVNEEQDSTSYSSSSIPSTSDESSSSDSSSDDDDDKDVKNNKADANDDNENSVDSSDSSDDEDDDDDDDDNTDEKNRVVKDHKTDRVSETTKLKTPNMKIIISSSEEDDEEEESSDDSQEVDLVSSDDDGAKDDEKDTDYKASEDEDDVVMVSDEEFKSKGRAVVPSPPHTETKEQEEMEVLVENVPDFNPIISSIMFNEQGSKP